MAEKKKRGQGEWSFVERAGRKGQWVARKQFGKKENGKPNIVCLYGKSKTDVRQKAADYDAKLLTNRQLNTSKETVYGYVKKWMETTKRHSVKATTYDCMEDSLEIRLKPYNIADIQMCNLSVQLCQEYINNLVECDGHYSLATIRKSYNLLNGAFKYAAGSGDIAKNPMEFVELPKEASLETKTKDILFFTDDQMTKIYAEANTKTGNGKPHYYYGIVIEILARTGMRIGECLALKWCDVDLENRNLMVDSTISTVKNRNKKGDTDKKRLIIDSNPKTEKSIRKVRLSNKAVVAFENIKSQNIMYGLPVDPDNYVVLSHRGNLGSSRNIRRSFNAILEKIGIPDYDEQYGLHTLRHTFASTLLRKGIDVKVVSTLLGHKKVSTTYNTYIHIIEEQQNSALDAIDDL